MTLPRRGSWLTLGACLLAVTMQMIDVTAVTVALPTIARDLDASGTQQVWIPTAYLLAFACALLTMARAGEVFGRRTVFVTGTALFAVTSVLCAYAPTVELLVLAGADRLQHPWVGERGEGERDALPNGVAGARVGLQHPVERLGPSGRGVGVRRENGDGIRRSRRVERPAE